MALPRPHRGMKMARPASDCHSGASRNPGCARRRWIPRPRTGANFRGNEGNRRAILMVVTDDALLGLPSQFHPSARRFHHTSDGSAAVYFHGSDGDAGLAYTVGARHVVPLRCSCSHLAVGRDQGATALLPGSVVLPDPLWVFCRQTDGKRRRLLGHPVVADPRVGERRSPPLRLQDFATPVQHPAHSDR